MGGQQPQQAQFRRIADGLRNLVQAGALQPGDKLVSARMLAEREQVSVPTALQALRSLEAEGLVVAKPRSGFVVRQASMAVAPQIARGAVSPKLVTMSALAVSLFSHGDQRLVPLGAALPDPVWLPTADLQRYLLAAGRKLEARGQTYSMPPGRLALRRQIAARAALWGAAIRPDEVVVTTGATQAVRLALQAVCKPGDVVAIERPAYFGSLLLLQELGLKALEIPTDPQHGLQLDALDKALAKHRVAAVLAQASVQNPLGAAMPLANKQALVQLLARHAIPLIEDDVYGDLTGADALREPACKAFDQHGGVLYCSSVSKTLAPGWRIGWVAAGRYHERVQALRLAGDWAGVPMLEAAVADYLAGGDYDRHLRRLKAHIALGVRAMVARVQASFPAGTRLLMPRAGFLLWVALPPGVDALKVHAHALRLGIGVSPGQLFSPQSDLHNFLRLNCANEPTYKLLRAVDQLGQICTDMLADRP